MCSATVGRAWPASSAGTARQMSRDAGRRIEDSARTGGDNVGRAAHRAQARRRRPHTGGTLDKLEAIPGFRTGLSLAEAKAQVMTLGCAMIGQTPEIAPADRRLYALRDVTGTVAAIPLIAASIMSKKLAEGLNALVLDVKRGSGAFLPKVEQSLELAQTMIALGEDGGCPTVALLTAMDRPP